MKERYRTIDQVIEDGLWPTVQLRKGSVDSKENIRYRALEEVLCCIPEKDYEKLKAKIDYFDWFIPPAYSLGSCRPFFSIIKAGRDEFGKIGRHVRVLYLSPILENRAYDIVVGVVAHELAHLAMGHSLFPNPNDSDRQEKEAYECVVKWGFEKEVRKHRASQKRKGILVG
jgi:hypothetical protein